MAVRRGASLSPRRHKDSQYDEDNAEASLYACENHDGIRDDERSALRLLEPDKPQGSLEQSTDNHRTDADEDDPAVGRDDLDLEPKTVDFEEHDLIVHPSSSRCGRIAVL